MGKKISWEDAERLGAQKNKSESIYAPQNKYGYKTGMIERRQLKNERN